MRERRYIQYTIHSTLRITPACAGRTSFRQSLCTSQRDHPRSRGKDAILNIITNELEGSPPLAREGHSEERFHTKEAGITPAFAGRTYFFADSVYISQDHPRMCGKDYLLLNNLARNIGSPPHVREGLQETVEEVAETGITPACAGRTQTMKMPTRLFQDHPRMCGKDSEGRFKASAELGSPPHVREGPFLFLLLQRSSRITPACAGRTQVAETNFGKNEDHPRMCGKDHNQYFFISGY